MLSVWALLQRDPVMRDVVVIEHLDIGVGEQALYPRAPADPLIARHDRDFTKIELMFAAELDLFPGDIDGEAEHVAQVEQNIQRTFELDAI